MKLRLVPMLFPLLFCFSVSAKAERVERYDAQSVAVNFMAERINAFSPHAGFNLAVADVIVRHHENIAVYYAVNFAGGGFVIVAADDILTPVIGYAYAGAYASENRPCCFERFIDARAEEAAYLIKGGYQASTEIASEWTFLRSGETRSFAPEATKSVQPLIMSPWNQNFPYNALCPEDPDGSGGYAYAGCVATAMAMIMYYYRYPDHGQGEKTYYTARYGWLHANFGDTWYDWDAMQNIITNSSGNSIVAAAELQYHCGVAVSMQYGPDGSGAFSEDVPSATHTYFRFSNQINYIRRAWYSYSGWINILIGQLDDGYPAYYSGQGSGGGHAWVCDGYQYQGPAAYFHMKWGWGDSFNGYYHLDSLNPGGGDFNSWQAMVRNFYPPPANYPFYCTDETKVITSSRGSIDDGSGPIYNYQDNINCSWLIAPTDSVNNITLNFLKFNTQNNDVVTIYDGDNDSAPVLGAFSGNNLPGAITSTGNRMFIRFITDASGNAPGWLAEFSSSLPVFCSGLVQVFEPHGEFSDGSGEHNYNNNSWCRWYIRPPGADSLTLTFTSFDTEPVKDFVRILQIPGNQVLGEFSGDQIPPPVTSATGQMMVLFMTNQFNTAPGWSAWWTTGVIPGDANCDGEVNVSDIITMIAHIIGQNPDPFCFENADVNGDGLINIQDVVDTVNIVLGK